MKISKNNVKKYIKDQFPQINDIVNVACERIKLARKAKDLYAHDDGQLSFAECVRAIKAPTFLVPYILQILELQGRIWVAGNLSDGYDFFITEKEDKNKSFSFMPHYRWSNDFQAYEILSFIEQRSQGQWINIDDIYEALREQWDKDDVIYSLQEFTEQSKEGIIDIEWEPQEKIIYPFWGCGRKINKIPSKIRGSQGNYYQNLLNRIFCDIVQKPLTKLHEALNGLEVLKRRGSAGFTSYKNETIVGRLLLDCFVIDLSIYAQQQWRSRYQLWKDSRFPISYRKFCEIFDQIYEEEDVIEIKKSKQGRVLVRCFYAPPDS